MIDFDRDADELVGRLQDLVKRGDRKIIDALFDIAGRHDETDDPEKLHDVGVALESLATARNKRLALAIRVLIAGCLRSRHEEVRFAALAAAGELPSAHRAALRYLFERMAANESEEPDTRREARTLLDQTAEVSP